MGSLTSIPSTRFSSVTMSRISIRNWYKRRLSKLHRQVSMASHGLQCTCSGAPSRGWMCTAKALNLHFGLLSICANRSLVLIVIGGHGSMTYLSSKDSPSMVKVTNHKVQFKTCENEENHSIPSNIPCGKVDTIRKTMLQT